jgi:uncharacterized repeat protein (TIGR01451 family)
MRYSNLKLTGAALALLMTTSAGAYAQTKTVGTTAGTEIASTVNLSFKRGSATVATTASATFHVDRKIDMIMDTPHDTDIVLDLGAGTFSQAMTFDFTNYSNATADFTITVDAPAGFTEGTSGDDTYSILVDGVALANGGTISVAAGAEPEITVVARFDPDTNATRTFEVTAAPTAAFAVETGRDITVAGAANMNTIHLFDADDQKASATVVLSSPLLTASKTVAVISQDASFDCASGVAAGGAQAAIPGACIEYTITVNNTGGAAMRELAVTDTMPAGITLVSASSSFFAVTTSGADVTAEASGNLTAGESAELKIRATID